MKKAWVIYLEHDFDTEILHLFEGGDAALFMHVHKLQNEHGDLKLINKDDEKRIVKWQIVGSGTMLIAQERESRK
jgi:hypothetical protein